MNCGIIGTAFASCITYLSALIILVIYIYYHEELHKALVRPSGDTFRNLSGFFVYILPGILMITIETWLAEIMTLLASYLGVTQMGAQTILNILNVTIFMLSTGMQESLTVLVGSALGENDVHKAKRYARVGIYA